MIVQELVNSDFWLRPALVANTWRIRELWYEFVHLEQNESDHGLIWTISKLDSPVYINHEDMELHPPMVALYDKLQRLPERKVQLEDGHAFLLEVNEWEETVPAYVGAKRFLDPLRLWQRDHANRREDYLERKAQGRLWNDVGFPEFDVVFQKALQEAQSTGRSVQVSGSSGMMDMPTSTIIYLHPDGTLETHHNNSFL